MVSLRDKTQALCSEGTSENSPAFQRRALGFGHFARQRRAGISAQGNALGKPSRNPNPPCRGESSCVSPTKVTKSAAAQMSKLQSPALKAGPLSSALPRHPTLHALTLHALTLTLILPRLLPPLKRNQQFSLWPCDPAPGEGTRPTNPQNRHLVGRVPSPGVPTGLIMRIAASEIPALPRPILHAGDGPMMTAPR